MSDLVDLPHLDPADRRSLTRSPRDSWRVAGVAVLDLVGHRPMIDLTDLTALIDAADPTGRTGRTDRDALDHPRPRRASATARPTTDGAVAVLIPLDDARIEHLVDQWLTDREQAVVLAKGSRARTGHVLGRVAAKQAIQAHLASRGFAELAADRIDISNDDRGCPIARVRGARVAARHLRISIAHAGSVAVAVAASSPCTSDAPGVPGIGIDIEPVEPRSTRFERLTLTAAEQELAPAGDDDRDTWLTRLWSAKEAAAKATGLGLRGRPKDFAVVEVDGEHLRIADRWIATERLTVAGATHIVATAADHRTERSWRPS